MTFLAWLRGHHEWPETTPTADMAPSMPPTPSNISVVVPVRDNQAGINVLLRWWTAAAPAAELVVVDDGSTIPVVASEPNVKLIRTRGHGPASARNTGWLAARGPWVAFVDSDCTPDGEWPRPFISSWAGEVAMQGRVTTAQRHVFATYYESQRVLTPMHWDRNGRPRYLITANALVWRPALELVGGFHRAFQLAAGEDIDLGYRLAAVGRLGWAPMAIVTHEWEASLAAFVRRFHRYGRGNRQLAHLQPSLAPLMRPIPFRARSPGILNSALAQVAWLSLATGWLRESAGRTVSQGAVGAWPVAQTASADAMDIQTSGCPYAQGAGLPALPPGRLLSRSRNPIGGRGNAGDSIHLGGG